MICIDVTVFYAAIAVVGIPLLFWALWGITGAAVPDEDDMGTP